MKNLFFMWVIWAGFYHSAHAQFSIDVMGGNSKSPGYSFSYSIGETSTLTLKSSGNKYFATSGVIQPDPALIIKVSEVALDAQILFPNPSDNFIRFYPGIVAGIEFAIYRYDGVLMQSGKLSNSAIDVHEFVSGLYYVRLYDVKSKFSKIYQFVRS